MSSDVSSNKPMKAKPLITIIVAVFNCAETLQQCIDSVVNQTCSRKELIIIDGGSTDGTVDLLKANHDKIDYYISEPDTGIYNAWNKGLSKASGEWICFLGADDFLWDQYVLERAGQKLNNLSLDLRIAYGRVMLLNESASPLYLVGVPWEKVRLRFKKTMCIPHQGVFHRRSLFDLHGVFDESFRIAGDYELLLRELDVGRAFYLTDIISGMRQGGVSNNAENSLAILAEFRQVQRKHGQKLPNWIWLMALLRLYIRLIVWKVIGEKQARKVFDVYRKLLGLPSHWTRT